jgi:hypothetical protein
MYVCVLCTCVNVFVCICMCESVYVCVCLCTYMCIYVFLCMSLCMCVYECLCVCMRLRLEPRTLHMLGKHPITEPHSLFKLLVLQSRITSEPGTLPEMVPSGSREEDKTQSCLEAVMGGKCSPPGSPPHF